MAQQPKNLTEFIKPLQINGLDGRVLELPAPKNKRRNILLLYGSHASIERMMGLAEYLNRYGAVTLPDLPGFGGMDSFYKIGLKPNVDTMADYLASFVKMHYKRKRLSIVAMSFGFVVATRMLQRNPELADKVDLIISLAGFAHYEDFKFTKPRYLFMRWSASFFSNRLPAWIYSQFLRGPVIRSIYKLVERNHAKFKDGDAAERRRRIDFEINLWKINDVRTYMDTAVSMFTLNLCDMQVDLPLWHVTVEPDHFFDNAIAEQHLLIIYKDVKVVLSDILSHAPTVVATAEQAAPFVPPKLRRILGRQS